MAEMTGYKDDLPRQKLATTLKDASKEPVVLVACGSFSPITFLHLRLFETARDYLEGTERFEVLGGYLSPVNDAYTKPGLVSGQHRVRMCQLAVDDGDSDWVSTDAWEVLQPTVTPTARVLERFARLVNVDGGAIVTGSQERRPIRVMLLAGADLIESMNVPGLWSVEDMHTILEQYGCVVAERSGTDLWQVVIAHDVLFKYRANIHVVKQLVRNDVSSTKIRLSLRRGLSVKYLVPDKVIVYIAEHQLFTYL